MKGTLTVLCAGLAFSWVAIAGAAGQSGYGQPGSSQSDKHSKSSREVTLTGCLEQGSNPNSYVLRNATQEEGQGGSMSNSSSSSSGSSSQSGSSSSSQGEQTGTSGQSSMQGSQSGMDYQLVGKDKDLKKYVGQRVQVRGTVEPMREGESGMSSQSGSGTGEASGMSGSQGTSGTQSSGQSGSSMGSGSTSGQSSSAVMHRVKVTSVKQLGSSCQ